MALLRALLTHVDVLIDPFRPGVLENWDLAPSKLLAANPRLIIARLTGFRRDGSFAKMAGHDINYLAVSGVLSQLGRKGSTPYPPANILADFAGGGLICALGIVMALFVRVRSGKGQLVENNMVDGSAYLATMLRYARKTPIGDMPRGENLLDGGCPWYDVYECRDGGYMAVGALEPQFFERLLRGLDLEAEGFRDRENRTSWPTIRSRFQDRFREKTRAEWETVFKGEDACCTPVQSQEELEKQAYEQRLPVHLTTTPGLPICQRQAWESNGLAPGVGGEALLETWMNWKRGRNYQLKNGGLEKMDPSKL